jgi:septal ring factor EnvC (AmiA/AmiB activator)
MDDYNIKALKTQAENISKLQDKVKMFEFDYQTEKKKNNELCRKLKEREKTISNIRRNLIAIIRDKDYSKLNILLKHIKGDFKDVE